LAKNPSYRGPHRNQSSVSYGESVAQGENVLQGHSPQSHEP